jgi:exonuclease III
MGSDGCSCLEQVMRCMRVMNIDLGLLTETKLVKGKHTVSTEGCDIVTTEAKSKHQGGVALFYRKSENFHVGGTKAYGPNVIGTTLVSGRRKWRIVGAYIPPSEVDGSTLDFIQAAAAGATHRKHVCPKLIWNSTILC